MRLQNTPTQIDQLLGCGVEAVTADWIAPYIFEIIEWYPKMVLLGGFDPGIIQGRWSLCGASPTSQRFAFAARWSVACHLCMQSCHTTAVMFIACACTKRRAAGPPAPMHLRCTRRHRFGRMPGAVVGLTQAQSALRPC